MDTAATQEGIKIEQNTAQEALLSAQTTRGSGVATEGEIGANSASNTPRKYRKKPVVIEAMRFTDESKDRVFNWVSCNRSADFEEDGEGNGVPVLRIQTLEGVMTAQLGDWIIRGVQGEFYPCKPEIFEVTYEVADALDERNQLRADLEAAKRELDQRRQFIDSKDRQLQAAGFGCVEELIARHAKIRAKCAPVAPTTCAVCQHPFENHRVEDNACPSIDGQGYSSAHFRPDHESLSHDQHAELKANKHIIDHLRLEVESLRADLAYARQRIEVLEGALQTIRDRAEYSITSDDVYGAVEVEFSEYVEIADKALSTQSEATKPECPQCGYQGEMAPGVKTEPTPEQN